MLVSKVLQKDVDGSGSDYFNLLTPNGKYMPLAVTFGNCDFCPHSVFVVHIILAKNTGCFSTKH
jgi:hypothetical protein